MSLIAVSSQEKAHRIAEQICDREAAARGKTAAELSRELPIEGITQTVYNLEMSIYYGDCDFFPWTGKWSCIMMVGRIPGMDEEQTRQYMLQFCKMFERNLWWLEKPEEKEKAQRLLTNAEEEIRRLDFQREFHDYLSEEPYADYKRQYLKLLLDHNMTGAMQLMMKIGETVTFSEICGKIIPQVMKQVGEFWLFHKISVAEEHFCTAATQTILAMFYPRIVSSERNGKRAVIACVGSELHEMGARIISDLLEEDGWESMFLGAAVPEETLLETVLKIQPQLCAISVVLPQGMPACGKAVRLIRQKSPDTKVAVGGHAFEVMAGALPAIGADIYTSSAEELIRKADELT